MEEHCQTDTAPESRTERLRNPDDWVKLLAFGLMAVDHVGWLLLPGEPWLRWLGRLSMPLFAYLIAVGFSRTRSPLRYAGRLLLVGLVSQPVFWWVSPNMGTHSLNIFFTLALGLGWLAWRKKDPFTAWLTLGGLVVTALAFGADPLFAVTYGTYGVLCVALLDATLVRPAKPRAMLAFVLLSAASLGWALRLGAGGRQELAGLAVLLVLACAWKQRRRMTLPARRWLYFFYPVHLLLLGLLARLLGIPVP